MKLEKIKLLGFKSFVDPTTIPIHSGITAVVGPNGCGKSNVIDAVRWVMGESSAKHLRGGSMTDVIFNGCATRKAASSAMVELIFDNSEGKLAGEYARYDKLAIKRQVGRDGQSNYSLNGVRCRRKDITDLFLGTGLGSRSYAIIEQGMISRMIEAKPDELRVFIEEAAGISKYKERRHETELSIGNTRENLARLQDVRDEVATHLKHLHKQAQRAEKYTALKTQQRQFKLELLAMRWQQFQQKAQTLELQLQSANENYQQLLANVHEAEQHLTLTRDNASAQQQQLATLQADDYQFANEINSLEQAIAHTEQNQLQLQQEIARLQQQIETISVAYQQDLAALESSQQAQTDAKARLEQLEIEKIQALAAQQQGRQQQTAWQEQWEKFRQQSAKHHETQEVQRVKIAQWEIQQRQLQARLAKLQLERDELIALQTQHNLGELETAVKTIEEQRQLLNVELTELQQHLTLQKQQLKQQQQLLHQARFESQTLNGKLTSLELLQRHATGKDKQQLNAWLKNLNLDNTPRLLEGLEVASGWERAVEIVLGQYLQAVCVENTEQLIAQLPQLTKDSVTIFAAQPMPEKIPKTTLPKLISKIIAPWDLTPFLSSVYCVENLTLAWQLKAQLKTHESIITQDGIWLGRDWLKTFVSEEINQGVLQRETEYRELKQRKIVLEMEILTLETQLTQLESAVKVAEIQVTQNQQQEKVLSHEFSTKNAQLSVAQTRLEQQTRRLQQLATEIAETEAQMTENENLLAQAQQLKLSAQQQGETLAVQQQELESQRQRIQSQQHQLNEAVNQVQQQLHKWQAQCEAAGVNETATLKQLERLQLQQNQVVERLAELKQQLQTTLAPLASEKQALLELQLRKKSHETVLGQQRTEQQTVESALKKLTATLNQQQQTVEQQRQTVETLRFELQENTVRQQTLDEQLVELNADPAQIFSVLPENFEENQWKKQLDELTASIERLGSINLAAIDEHKVQAERLAFIEAQHKDVSDALQTLELAIAKIDKESRLRFKETFDKINTGLQAKFPKLFGGGYAYLESSDPNILESGVNIVARPPGKKNTSIHLLSGGEKALAAIALVFAIFELNPAPFCLLDEVDAPLDDTNVGRFSAMVAEMSATVQFLFISHNKATMEIAQQLTGVTMKEAGVSRMVAVNIEDAVQLAEHNG